MDNFIGVFENAFTDDLCNRMVQAFQYADSSGFTRTRQQHEDAKKSSKNDKACFSTDYDITHSPIWNEFSTVFWSVYPKYSERYAEALETGCGEYKNYSVKIQKTMPSEGYHAWHFEASERPLSNRIVVWTAYLNDVEEGGETEFLYQKMRVKPKKGTLCFFPAGYTHVHRGNPPLSGEKYIATGWLEL